MYLDSIVLKNFKNHHNLNIQFSSKINAITGENGAGKTNIVEAIHYLSLGRSFRTNSISDLISYDATNAYIEANVRSGDIKRNIKVVMNKNSRIILINGKPIKRISELSSIMNVILFEPGDVNLFRGLPKERRNFLDVSISKQSSIYLKNIIDYTNVLRERNDTLKRLEIDKNLLSVQTDMLVKLSKPIVDYRDRYIKDINNILKKITRALTGEEHEIKIVYSPFVPNDSLFTASAYASYKKQEDNEIKRKTTLVGPHRDDFVLMFNGKDVSKFGSQGENRISALALKLSPFFLIEDKDKRPIVVLDDVLSELDNYHKTRLLMFMEKFEQVFITSTSINKKDINEIHIPRKEN